MKKTNPPLAQDKPTVVVKPVKGANSPTKPSVKVRAKVKTKAPVKTTPVKTTPPKQYNSQVGRGIFRDFKKTTNIPKELSLLGTILRKQRPHGSKEELEFCKWLRGQLSKLVPSNHVVTDSFGNIHVNIGGDATAPSGVLFSCHVDTVHREATMTKTGWQTINYDAVREEIFVVPEKTASNTDIHTCLGADDGAGIWIMMQMIQNKVPGYYTL